MELEYGDLLSPSPIRINGVGTIKKPFLRDIADLSFSKFYYYELFLKMTPEKLYTKYATSDEAKKAWEELPDDTKQRITMYDLILNDTFLQRIYEEVFGFFFEENVKFEDGIFKLFMSEDCTKEKEAKEAQNGITPIIFQPVVEVIQQVCNIYVKEDSLDDMKFKNNTARKLMEKMLKGKKKREEQKKDDPSYSLPNIISAVSNYHKSINPATVWDLTLYQLMDAFDRLRRNVIFDVDKRRVSVWGDEKKQFDTEYWFKYIKDVK